MGKIGNRLTASIDPAQNLDDESWIDRIEDIAEEHGYFEPLGPDHSATFIEGGSTLLVSFETMESIRDRVQTDVPLGWEIADATGCAQLCIISHGETWFRHRAVYMFFDRLVDEAFFDDYDRVVFYGSESCGYAAAAFSVTAPGATVLALSPQATLDPRMTEWDERFIHMRRADFTSRYGYAPDMLDAAERAFILYDPSVDEDAMHAALFRKSNTSRIRCPLLDGHIEMFLRRMSLLGPMLQTALRGELDEMFIFNALRARRHYLPYLRALLHQLELQERPYLMALMCRAVLRWTNIPRFQRRLAQALRELEGEGRSLPPERRPEPA